MTSTTQNTLSHEYEGYEDPEIKTYKLNGELSRRLYVQTRILKYIEGVAITTNIY